MKHDFRRVSRIETVTAIAIFLVFVALVLMHSRRAVALEMREGLARQHLVTQELETTVAQRTRQLAQMNQQLLQELADRLSAEEGLGEKVKMLNQAEVEREELIASLGGALSEKTVLLQEVHHRVKNNMAVIAGLLALQAETLDNEQARTALEESQRRVLSMAMIHEYLYATENLDRVNFGKYVHQLANELLASYSIVSNSVDLAVEAEEIDLPVDRAIPCALILNELLSNALKYAFPAGRRGEIKVQFGRLQSGELSLSCQDDGIGISDSFDWRNPHSLGLRIVSILTKQINGELVLEDRAGGTGFELRFPAG
jgi:two-component sensor histidine kinase